MKKFLEKLRPKNRCADCGKANGEDGCCLHSEATYCASCGKGQRAPEQDRPRDWAGHGRVNPFRN
jgi:hypothetical protein